MNDFPIVPEHFHIPIEAGQAWELMAPDFILREKLLSQELSNRFRQEQDALYSGRPRTDHLNARIELEVTQADCTLERYFKACCEVWEAQCRTKCRAFFLAVLHFVLIPTLQRRCSTSGRDIHLRHHKAHKRDLSLGMQHFTEQMGKLHDKWSTRIDIASTIDLPPLPSFKQGGSPESKRQSTATRVRCGRAKIGRPNKLPANFVQNAGELWRVALSENGSRVLAEQLVHIAEELDAKGFAPPANYFPKGCAELIRAFNSKHANAKAGPIRTWKALVSQNDKDFVREMRRLLSRCAANLSGK